MPSPLDHAAGLWRSYQFAIWTPLPAEQAAVQLERSLVARSPNTPLPGRLYGSVATDHFTLRHSGAGFGRQHPMINGQIVNSSGGGSYVVGEIAYGTVDKVLVAMGMIVLTTLFGLCGISYLFHFHDFMSVLVAAVPCAGVPTICLVGLSTAATRTSTYHKALRAYISSVLHGVDVTGR